jgi:hypothetical protein
MNDAIKDLIEKYANTAVCRIDTFSMAFDLAESIGSKVIVETGCMRCAPDNNPDGASTFLIGNFAKSIGARLISMELFETNVQSAKLYCSNLPVDFVVGDSIRSLKEFGGKIDFLYLDSHDCDHIPGGLAQQHQLNEAIAAKDKLSEKAVVLSDDWKTHFNGKGGLSIPFLHMIGFKTIYHNYQIVLARL